MIIDPFQHKISVESREKLSQLSLSIVSTLEYSNYYKYPLTISEIQSLLGQKATDMEVNDSLQNELIPIGIVKQNSHFYQLVGYENLVEIRRKRAIYSTYQWNIVYKIKKIFASVPYVEMVAITGSLAVDNSNLQSDIDFFVVTKEKRLWLTRAILFFVEKYLERVYGIHLCFNYIISTSRLLQSQQNKYVARELIQMKPIYGENIYNQLIRKNSWIFDYFPNFDQKNSTELIEKNNESYFKSLIHRSDKGIYARLLDIANNMEFKRAMSKLVTNFNLNPETSFSINTYKAHFQHHQKKILSYMDKSNTRRSSSTSTR